MDIYIYIYIYMQVLVMCVCVCFLQEKSNGSEIDAFSLPTYPAIIGLGKNISVSHYVACDVNATA